LIQLLVLSFSFTSLSPHHVGRLRFLLVRGQWQTGQKVKSKAHEQLTHADHETDPEAESEANDEVGHEANHADRESLKLRYMNELLRTQFGFSSFRPGQKELISHILDGQDVLGILPTGAGKSLCYELASRLLPGMTFVITPLISLMQDQVESLSRIGIPAAFVNSSQSPELSEQILSDTVNRHAYKILYVAPERLDNERFIRFARRIPLRLLAIDEAHCVSQWGQDFRPAYLRIPDFVDQLPHRPVIAALTATATVRTRRDIIAQLHLRDPFIQVTTFDRPNLTWKIRQCGSKQERDDAIVDDVLAHRDHSGNIQSGIVYCSTRQRTEDLADELSSAGVKALAYHAGLNSATRAARQDAFVSGKVPVITATSAFGMGIDKPDVRWVIHANAPESLEEYYQEAGRAGRDGKPSDCTLYWMEGDFRTSRHFIAAAGRDNDELTPEDRVRVHQLMTDRLEALHSYCLTTRCLRNTILAYFGEKKTEPCGRCTNCTSSVPLVEMASSAREICAGVDEADTELPYGLGRAKLAAILTGRMPDMPDDSGPDYASWSSYGVLGEMSVRQVEELIDRLVAGAYLQITGRYGTVHAGPKVDAVSRKDFSLRVPQTVSHRTRALRSPRSAWSAPSAFARSRSASWTSQSSQSSRSFSLTSDGEDIDDSDDSDSYDEGLFKHLRSVRYALAKKKDVPSFTIFTNATLRAMAAHPPRSTQEMAQLPGVGPVKLARYGDLFLKEIRSYRNE
jgi:ATP-dependent DNA helicase RecQ